MASDGCAIYVDVYGLAAAFCRRLSAKTQNIDLMEGKLSENLFLTEANCIAHILLCERYTHEECAQYGCWLRYQCEDW